MAGELTMSMSDAKVGMSKFLQAQEAGQKVYYMPYYYVVNLAGLADPTTGLLNPREIYFFGAGVGQPGQNSGFTRALTSAETSMPAGSNGVMPGGVEYIADALGVDFFSSCPLLLKQSLAEKSFVDQRRLSHKWVCGATRYWPCSEFGLQSASVATTIANTQIDFGVNGSVGMRQLPNGGELYFPANQQISFVVTTVEPIWVTTDGAPINAERTNVLTEALLAVVMTGWQFEVLTT